MAGATLPVALVGGARHHRHPLERLGLLRAQEPAGQGAMTMSVPATKPVVRKLRCAVYTRKSSEEGLDMEFNSLDAQREACEAYVASQRPEGWILVPDRYDDGGISGATLERPALKRLLRDIEAGSGRCGGRLQDRPAVALADGFFKTGRCVRRQQRHLRLGDPVLQHHHLHGQADAEHPFVLRPVRARGDRRAHQGQVRGLAQEGHVDGRLCPARLPAGEPQAAGRGERGSDRPHDLRAVPDHRLGHHPGQDPSCRGRHHAQRQADRQGLPLQAPQQPHLCRRRRSQGNCISRRAHGHHHAGALGQGAQHHCREPAQEGGAEPQRRRRHCSRG